VVGGTGIAEIVGAATPVCAPLTPLPVQPSSTSDAACPQQTSEALPASLQSDSDGGTTAWMWIAIGAAIAGLAVAAALVFRRRRAQAEAGVDGER
jgi:hypothetical protein